MPYEFAYRLRSAILSPIVLSLAVGVFFLQPSSSNAQWRFTPSLGTGIEYDDNPVLITDSALISSISGYLIEADAAIVYESQLTDFSLTPGLLLSRYNDSPELDSEDYFLDFDYDYSAQRTQFRFRGTYGDESVRNAERSDVDLELVDPADIIIDNSGQVLSTRNRQRVQLTPQWSYQVMERSVIRLGANFIDVTYDNRDTLLVNTDYRETKGTASVDYAMSEKNTVTFDGFYRANEFDIVGTDFSGYGLLAGLRRSLTEKSSFVFKIGIDSTEDDLSENQTNSVGEISLVRRMQTYRVLATYRRAVSGSGAGSVSLRDSIALNFTRDINEKLAIGAGITAYQTRALDDTDDDFDARNYLQLRASLSRHLTRTFTIELDYSYTNIDRETLSSDADSNRVNLWLRYSPRH